MHFTKQMARRPDGALRKGLLVIALCTVGAQNAAALTLGPSDVSISDCGSGACIAVNPGAGTVALTPDGTTLFDIDIDFNGRILLGDPGFGPPPFPGFPPPANPWEIVLTFEHVSSVMIDSVSGSTETGDLIFTGLDGGSPDLSVNGNNFENSRNNYSVTGFSMTYDVSQAQAGLVPGLGFGDIHLKNLSVTIFESGDITLTELKIDPGTVELPAIPLPAGFTLMLAGIGSLGCAAALRRCNGPRGPTA